MQPNPPKLLQSRSAREQPQLINNINYLPHLGLRTNSHINPSGLQKDEVVTGGCKARNGMVPGLIVLLNSPWILPRRWQHNQGSKGQTSQELNKLKLISREALQGRQSPFVEKKRRLKHSFPGALRKVSWIRIIIPPPIFSRFVIKVSPPPF